MVAGFRSADGASRQILRAALRQEVDLVISVGLAFEYEAVLVRPVHRNAIGLTQSEIREVLDALLSTAILVRTDYLWRPLLADPEDEMVLETCLNGGASHLLTFNTRHYKPVAERLGVTVLDPASGWRRMRR